MWRHLVLVVFVGLSPVIVITATPEESFPAVIGFSAVYVNASQVDLIWTKPPTADNVTIRAKYGSYPADRTDGYLVYYGSLETFSDTSMDFEETAGRIYYRAWAEYAGDNWSNPAGADVEGIGMTLLALVLLALGLTVAMFHTRNALLGFPSAIMWAILGGYAYTQSATPWGDWQFYLFFAAAFGMVVFSVLAAYSLREKQDTIADEEMGKGEGGYCDEGNGHKGGSELGFSEGEEKSRPSRRVRELRERAGERRTGERKLPRRIKWK